MKKRNTLIVALTLAVNMCAVNVGATVNVEDKTTVSNGQLVVRGSLDITGKSSINCVVAPKNADKTDLKSVLYIKEGTTAEDGSFAFNFLFDDSVAQGEYSVRVSDGADEISEFDFIYYPYEDIIDRIQNAASASELESILKDKNNEGVLGFLGIDASLLENSVINSEELVKSLYDTAKNDNLSFDETADLYAKLTAFEFINDGQKGWLEKFNPEFEGEKYTDMKSAEKKQWFEDRVYDSIKYQNVAALNSKYEELSIIYVINNATAGELGNLIDKYKDKLGIVGTSYFNSYSGTTQPQKIVLITNCAEAIKNKKLLSYSDFRQTFESVVSEATKNNNSGGISGGNGSGSGRGSSNVGSNVSIGTSTGANNNGAGGNNGRFSDVAASDWAKAYIEYLADKGVISGFEDGTFHPDEAVTREQFVKMIVTAFNLKTSGNSEMNFSDVNLGDWYYEYISAAYENDVVNGVSSDLFGVGRYISREDAATILNRAAKEKLNGDLPIMNAYKFLDDGSISDYAKTSVYSMYHAGIINGIGNDVFAPKDCCTRAQTAKMIYYLITKGE